MKLSLKGLSAVLFGISTNHNQEHTKITETLAKTATQQALNASHIALHQKRLDEGSEDFKKIRENISKINTNVAVLASKAKERRNEFEEKTDDTDS